MYDNEICDKCNNTCKSDDSCAAIDELLKLYKNLRIEEKITLIRELRKQLYLIDCEVSNELEELGNKVINAMPELNFIRDYEIKIGYVISYETKRDKGRLVNANCRKVHGAFSAYLPFDFVVTFYEPNMYYMTDNQKKILMMHELKHIGIGLKGFKIENHDVEDFKDILIKYGFEWNGFSQDVPDILINQDK